MIDCLRGPPQQLFVKVVIEGKLDTLPCSHVSEQCQMCLIAVMAACWVFLLYLEFFIVLFYDQFTSWENDMLVVEHCAGSYPVSQPIIVLDLTQFANQSG